MTLASLTDVLLPALTAGYAVPGFVCLGWEDARAYAEAAEDEGAPVILQAGPGARRHMPTSVWGAIFSELARQVRVPVVAHLDHGKDEDEIRAALDHGFSSVMYDGSELPLSENIDRTARCVELAHAAGASCEGELGQVGYAGGKASTQTDPSAAGRFVAGTGIDALAVSVGNVHLQTKAASEVDEAALEAISHSLKGRIPLVLHGGSGIPAMQRARLARATAVCKFNIGTELRQVFGAALRMSLADQPQEFDRIALLRPTEAPLRAKAREVFRNLGASGKA